MGDRVPEILVVLPTLGQRLDMLERALLSVEKQRIDVALTLIVVVPRTAREARARAKAHGAVVVNDPGRGMSEAINAGLSRRTTEAFYIWLGDDDYYQPGGLKQLRDLLGRSPDAVVAYGGCDYVDHRGQVVWSSRAGALATFLIGIGPNLVPHPAALIRLDAVEKVGGYDPSLAYVMDLDLFLRLKKLGRFVSTRKVVSSFGWHADSLTVHDRARSTAEARKVKRHYLPPVLRLVEPLWEYPVAWASKRAASALTKRQKNQPTH